MSTDTINTVCGPISVAKVRSMQEHGIQSMLDPCPNDLGRDVRLAAEVSRRTGFNIIPRLLEEGVTPKQIDALLVDNPRRFFKGEPQGHSTESEE